MFLDQRAVGREVLLPVLERFGLMEKLKTLEGEGFQAAAREGARMATDEEKTAFNVEAKKSMREFLSSKTWVEKVQSIERMNQADKVAKSAMRKALGEGVPSNKSK